MAKKKTKLSDISIVELYSKSLDQTRPFAKALAERVLNHSTGDWKLTEDSPFIFDKENGLRDKANTGASNETTE